MCMIDGAERFGVWVQTHPKAAKVHKCTECGRAISKGENYLHTKGLMEGSWSVAKVCPHCAVGADWLNAECGGYCQDFIIQEIREHAEEYRQRDLWRIVAAAGRKWTRRDGTMMPIPKLPRLSHPIPKP